MKLLRVIVGCTLLLLAASPSYALGCFTCNDFVINQCDSTPNSGTRCLFHPDYCETKSAPLCSGLVDETPSAILADWQVASIEVSHPAQGTKTVTSPAAVASADTTQSPVQK